MTWRKRGEGIEKGSKLKTDTFVARFAALDDFGGILVAKVADEYNDVGLCEG